MRTDPRRDDCVHHEEIISGEQRKRCAENNDRVRSGDRFQSLPRPSAQYLAGQDGLNC